MARLVHGPVEEFGVDTEELEATIAEMQRCEHALEQLTREVDAEVAELHVLWHGDAASAQRLAQLEWRRGLIEMRSALATYRASARAAHENYVEAAQVNARMWRQVT
jgi:WXG100 family type VII secretion target